MEAMRGATASSHPALVMVLCCLWFVHPRPAQSFPLAELHLVGSSAGRVVTGRAKGPFAALRQEGAVEFEIADSFYRAHSKVIRDMGVLALRVHGQRMTRMRNNEVRDGRGDDGLTVLDAMCGSGIRALRYIHEGGATFVLANDANDDLESERATNLRLNVAAGTAHLSTGDAMDAFFSARLNRKYFDLVDVDGFGSGAPYSAEAWWALNVGGLLYLCSTDARSAAGKNSPAAAWRGFGAVAQSMPASNELGVRLLVADAVRQAATRGFEAVPVFGIFHRQSSCSRVMLRLKSVGRKSCPSSTESAIHFAAYCTATGEHWVVPLTHFHDPRGAPTCPAGAKHTAMTAAGYVNADAAAQLRVTGPIWAGALHDEEFVAEMAAAAGGSADMREATSVIITLLQEVRQELPPMYFRLKEVGKFLAKTLLLLLTRAPGRYTSTVAGKKNLSD